MTDQVLLGTQNVPVSGVVNGSVAVPVTATVTPPAMPMAAMLSAAGDITMDTTSNLSSSTTLIMLVGTGLLALAKLLDRESTSPDDTKIFPTVMAILGLLSVIGSFILLFMKRKEIMMRAASQGRMVPTLSVTVYVSIFVGILILSAGTYIVIDGIRDFI